MTLLEKLDQIGTMAFNNELKLQELRRALAIAQAVDEVDNTGDYALAVCHEYMRYVMRRADELLKDGK